MKDIASCRRRFRSAAIRTIASTRSSSVDSETASTPARLNASLKVASRCSRGLSEAPPEALVVRVDVELLAGLGVLHDQRPDVGQLHLAPVEEPDGEHLVALGEQVERPLPAGALMKSEITKTSERRLIECWPASSSGVRSVMARRVAWRAQQVVDQAQDLDPAAAGRDRALDLAAVEDRADPVAVARQQPRQRRHEVDQDRLASGARGRRPEVDRRAQVEQEPGGDLAVLDVLADVRRVHPRGDVPVDVADVVAGPGTRAGRRSPRRSRGTGCGSRPGAGRRAGG